MSTQDLFLRRAGALLFGIGIPALILAAASCGGRSPAWQGTTSVENGVTVVRNPARGIWDGQEGRAPVTLAEEREIGALDGPPELTFASISSVAVGGNGDIFIADGQLCEIRKFNKDGKHLLTFGRKGQGPGEFQGLGALAIDRDGGVIAFDDMAGRVTNLSATGEFRSTAKMPPEIESVSPARIYATESGYVLFGVKFGGLALFHALGRDWSFGSSFIDYEPVDNKEFEMIQLGFYPGSCDLRSADDILYAKPFYDNQILVYKDRRLARIIQRESEIKKPYEIEVFHDVPKAMELQRERKYELATFGRGTAFLGRAFQTSAGLFRLASGKIVHFLSVRDISQSGQDASQKGQSVYDLAVEIYDPEGRLLIYSVLGPDQGYRLRCVDTSGLFCATAWRDVPKVVMFRLKGIE